MENRESILLPQDQNEGRVTSFAMDKEYLVFSTDVSHSCNKQCWVYKLFNDKFRDFVVFKKKRFCWVYGS